MATNSPVSFVVARLEAQGFSLALKEPKHRRVAALSGAKSEWVAGAASEPYQNANRRATKRASMRAVGGELLWSRSP